MPRAAAALRLGGVGVVGAWPCELGLSCACRRPVRERGGGEEEGGLEGRRRLVGRREAALGWLGRRLAIAGTAECGGCAV